MKPDWENFGRAVMMLLQDGDVEEWELEAEAVVHGILREEPYNVEQHGPQGRDKWGIEEGEPWLVRNYDTEAEDE